MGRYSSSGGGSIVALVIYGTIIIGSLGIWAAQSVSKLNSNRDNLDTEKAFNTVIDYDNGSVSIAKINSYSDYQGSTVEFTTQDGLQVVSGLDNAILVTGNDYASVYQEAVTLAGGEDVNVIYYDQLRGLDMTITNNGWSKNLLNLNYDFNYVIVETPEGVMVREITTYKDWDEDDKVQYQTTDGNVYLSDYQHVKLVNTELATPESLYYYAVSLAGSEDKVYGDINKEHKETSIYYEGNYYEEQRQLNEETYYDQTSLIGATSTVDKPKALILKRKS